MDIIGIVLSILSLFQGYKNKKTDAEKLKVIGELFDNIWHINTLLIDAKTVHDKVEGFFNRVQPDLEVLDNSDEPDKTPENIAKASRNFIKMLGDLVIDITIRKYSLEGDPASDIDTSISATCARDLREIYKCYPRMLSNLEKLEEYESGVRDLRVGDRKDRYTFMTKYIEIVDCANWLRRDADKVIRSTAELLSHFHHEAKSQVGQ